MTRLHALMPLVALIGLGGSASACLNDREFEGHEREFRSQYATVPTSSVSDQPARKNPVDSKVLIGGGAVMLIGAFSVATNRARSRV
ncbi:hypothetical protein TA3x_003591 [Tundrisphaera sp. TA3]|uniref:hypothetical protein n=1 Tax=Tundrisphaera sp. TA3 TaxID=3435775 RepID=UPI003EBFA0A9